MKLSDFYYDLPTEQIAQEPMSPRDHARLMVVRGRKIEHQRFDALDRLLRPDDVLVLNVTRVFPARLRGRKATGGKAEALLLAPLADGRWRALVRGATKPGTLEFADGVTAQIEAAGDEWLVRFSCADVRDFLERRGEMPLPPYIKRPAARAADRERYQTVFASTVGAVAAPTAGFHFTPELLERLRARGVEVVEIALHVGWGTFRPIRREDVENHPMLPERYEVSEAAAQALGAARARGRRVVAVGTTAVRTLETICDEAGRFAAGRGETSLYIYPGYRFRAINALITNFHLPDSTPLLLACAFKRHLDGGGSGGPPFALKDAYAFAVKEGYRFYSYGDAMLIE